MRITTRQPTSRRAVRRPARAVPRAAAHPTAEQRVRDEGGPRDTALYRCTCGCAFDDAVSTRVACPRCGAEQAW